MNGKTLKKEFGDYQTPSDFADRICAFLKNSLKADPQIIIEPTAGTGNFIQAALESFKDVKKIYGLEINPEYCTVCKERIQDKRLKIIRGNFFSYNLSNIMEKEDVLFLGNPPWATNSELKFNLPDKKNFKHLKGMDAITGSSNFDICESMILKMIEKSVGRNVSIAMLCKTSVARNILLELSRNNIPVEDVRMYQFDSGKVFGINAAACMFYVRMIAAGQYVRFCDIFDFDFPDQLKSRIIFENGKLNCEVQDMVNLDGVCEFEWRQGVKHDCAGVMELTKKTEGCYTNKNQETVTLEKTLVFPLIKSSCFKKPLIKDGFSKYVIVTQKKAREETQYIKELAPNTWEYLNERRLLFDRRKSSIYKGAPAFSMFGVGDYSYAAYKVGVSGFYKKPLFTLLFNEEEIERPVMLDDTSYFLSFDNYNDAYVCMLLLNSKKVQEFLLSISFRDAKRPYTKKVLQRLNIKKCTQKIDIKELKETEEKLGLIPYISDGMYTEFSEKIAK